MAEDVLFLIVGGGLAYGVWRFRLKHWPFGKCRRCGGSGRNAGSTSERFGRCRKCGGSGRRLRLGAREPDKRG